MEGRIDGTEFGERLTALGHLIDNRIAFVNFVSAIQPLVPVSLSYRVTGEGYFSGAANTPERGQPGPALAESLGGSGLPRDVRRLPRGLIENDDREIVITMNV
jgi:hypothetical protein